eukprot:3010170-Pleurochrysis_carterae.AAC.5
MPNARPSPLCSAPCFTDTLKHTHIVRGRRGGREGEWERVGVVSECEHECECERGRERKRKRGRERASHAET